MVLKVSRGLDLYGRNGELQILVKEELGSLLVMVRDCSRRNCLRMLPGASFFQSVLLKEPGVSPGISGCSSTVGEQPAPGLPLPAELWAARPAQKRTGALRSLWDLPASSRELPLRASRACPPPPSHHCHRTIAIWLLTCLSLLNPKLPEG